ncbi:uncharacterized protein PITG_00359 [Phytophthora infestans T30-4]|uniref:Uncharacterized protein n=1 Tax=Phytophthora infestans (strain T30-4) TaxID=403677 RepID=D0MQL2_PHYIT|nr:uncharacterized protein PITG_00359 [Phytophthora infestans T30-4]EEY57781.1 hypothetical protein PITG_00359 [Phytophthora infestans T30-4]|eukprot:XP_002908967.1 hypothetical protein PITG_00359 [Phytophthora infestans T30-4]
MSSEGVSSVDSEPRHRTNDSIGGCLEAGERADEWSAVTDRVLVGVVTANKTGTCGVRSDKLGADEDSTHDNEANNTADDGDGGLGLGDGYRDVSTTTAGHGESGSDS